MSNFRKAKKHGGEKEAVIIMECLKPNDTAAKCINALLLRDNFKRIKVPSDGNCYFHALAQYFKLIHNEGNHNYREIRKTVVDYMKHNIITVKGAIAINTTNQNNRMELYLMKLSDIHSDWALNDMTYELMYDIIDKWPSDPDIKKTDKKAVQPYLEKLMVKYLKLIEDLYADKVWASDVADLISQCAAKALNIKIKIYDIKAPVDAKKIYLRREKNGTKLYANVEAQPRKVMCYTFEPEYESDKTVYLLRINDGHYELLYPKDRNNGALAANLDEMKINNKKATTTRNTRKKTARSPSPRGAAAATSRSPPPRTSTATRRQRKTSLERALEQIAEAESKEAASRRSPSPPKAAAAAMPKAVTRRRPRVAPQRETSLERNLRLIAEAESREQNKSKLNNNFFLRLDDAKLNTNNR